MTNRKRQNRYRNLLLDFRAYGSWDTWASTPAEYVQKLEQLETHQREILLQPAQELGLQRKSPLNSSDPASNFCPQFTSKVSPVDPPEKVAYSCISRWQVKDFAKSWVIIV